MINRQLRTNAILLAAGMAAIAASASVARAATHTLVCELRGGQEVPPNPSTARGCGRFEINTNANTLKFYIAYGGLSSPETAAHIHGPAGPGVNAGIVFPLPAGSPKSGVWNYPEPMEQDILEGKMYVNIHTAMFGGGEIRGQINSMVAVLDPLQENPSIVGLASQGWATFNIDTCNNSLDYYIVVQSLGSAETAAHIHGMANIGTNAGIVHPLPLGSPKVGTWNYPESMETAILSGLTYVNVHTAANPGGEIRGQVVNFVVPLDALQEVPPNPSTATGCGYCTLNQGADSLSYYILYGGLTSAETAAHIHGYVPPGANAGVVHAFASGAPKKGVWNYPAANEGQILAGLTYANIHTANFGGGEIRGQMFTPIPKCMPDVNCDGQVSVTDLLMVINAWGACPAPPAPCPADSDYSGSVDVTDLLTIINGWGKCP